MKQRIIYSSVFLLAFILVTGVIIYFNSIYQNIFQFNFTLKSNIVNSDSTSNNSRNEVNTSNLNSEGSQESVKKDSVIFSSLKNDEISQTIEKDSLDIKKQDSSHKTSNNNDETIFSKNENPITTIKQPQTQIPQQIIQSESQQNNKPSSSSQDYTDWVKKASKIYSAMEPKKAAKIIQTYSDNVARDILYNMNQKTAAKVVSEFNPETANRIIRFE